MWYRCWFFSESQRIMTEPIDQAKKGRTVLS